MFPTSQTDAPQTKPILVDRFGRHVTYLRISVTDRCDLRCVYCMAEKMQFVSHSQLLTLEEMVRIGQAFVDLGVTKIRISGGEPLVRRNILYLFRTLGVTPGLNDFTLTTNATQLPKFANDLKKAGVTRINISLDTLRQDRFRNITRNGDINNTLQGIEAAVATGFERLKINAVILKNHNHDEILDLVEYAVAHQIDISFIEEMPLGAISEHNRAETYFSSDQTFSVIRKHYELLPSMETTGGPSRYFRIPDLKTRIGFISPHSHNFCDSCNRVRLTAEGRLLLCLGQEHSVDLRQVVRSYPDDDEILRQTIIDSMAIKPKGHEFDLSKDPVITRHMNHTGG
ncbi:MAG TPA: GTP 3',8-cyclase MoaA [Gammaproteobacteria bacterium]|nr:GTP 3',8-cyclase MoaA [Gammaproteobacteria bacterium]